MIGKHTPGPWRDAGGGREKHMIYATENGVPRPVADVGWSVSQERNKANAGLVSAAPDLLQALIDLVEMTEPLIIQGGHKSALNWYEYARAAIAKAKGGAK